MPFCCFSSILASKSRIWFSIMPLRVIKLERIPCRAFVCSSNVDSCRFFAVYIAWIVKSGMGFNDTTGDKRMTSVKMDPLIPQQFLDLF